MSVNLIEVIEAGGYDPLHDMEDARWLLSKQSEFEQLISTLEEVIDNEPTDEL